MAEPLIPGYGHSTLGDLVPSIGAAQGLPGWSDRLGLPAGDRWVLLLVDGLGALNLAAAADRAPFLASLLGAPPSGLLTSGAPSTTATSLSSLGTGLTPGEHGIVGYAFRHPFAPERALNMLVWEDGLSGLDVQPQLTAFERLAGQSVAVTSVTAARFEGSGLTTAGLRGGRFLGLTDERDDATRIGWAVDASAMQDRSFVYVYERFLDHTGHALGWRSPEWLEVLARVDSFALALRRALPDDVRLVVTGDHGMIDVPADRWLIAEDVPGLLDDVELLAGEGRFRQLYTTPGRTDAVRTRWSAELGERAWVLDRADAVARGLFGPVQGRHADRIGDVLVILREDWAVMTRSAPNEFSLIGMHGSLTEQEMTVPLLIS